MVVPLRKLDKVASGGVLLILFPVIMIVMFGAINYAMYDVAPVEKELYPEPIVNQKQIRSWWDVPGWIVWWASSQTPVAKFFNSIWDACGTLWKYLSLDIPLIATIAPFDVFIKAILWGSLIVGIADIAWIG